MSAHHPALIEIADDACHWPLGDDQPQRYCGQPKAPFSRSYCDQHHRVAYTTPRYVPAPADKANLVALAAAARAS